MQSNNFQMFDGRVESGAFGFRLLRFPSLLCLRRVIGIVLIVALAFGIQSSSILAQETAQQNAALSGFQKVVVQTQPAMVKIVGSGGFQGLEPYQSGFLISGEGHILTVWSYVLDSDTVTATLNDGQKFDAKLIGYDPRLEIAILKVDAKGSANFKLDEAVPAPAGSRVLAFSNLYGVATGNEPASVQHGIVSAMTELSARRGAFASMYQGKVYVLDAVTNNPGAAGGAITDRKGRLVGLIGKELRDAQTGSWLNFAIPIDELSSSVNQILDGKMVVEPPESQRKPSEPMTIDLIGIVMVPNVVSRTPPFVDRVVQDSVADIAGIRPDDLIIEVNGRMTPSSKSVNEQLSYIDRDAGMKLTIQRDREFIAVDIRLGR